MKISVITAVKGNALHIFDSLRSVEKLAAEIIVADIGMDPELKKKLLENKLVRVLTIDKPVPYIELIREELKQYATYDYIFFLDPDEIVPQTLIDELINQTSDLDYVSIPRKNLIFGKWIEHSRWWPDYQIRLFKKSAVSWPIKIHAQPQTQGKELKLDAKEELALVHYNYESIDEFMQKFVRYTKAEAEGVIREHKTITLTDACKRAVSEFISRYFAFHGYKDGMHGFVLAIMQMFYYFLVYFYYWEQKKYSTEDQSKTIQAAQSFFKDGFLETSYWYAKQKKPSLIERVKLKIFTMLGN